jgi:hypothetical protein
VADQINLSLQPITFLGSPPCAFGGTISATRTVTASTPFRRLLAASVPFAAAATAATHCKRQPGRRLRPFRDLPLTRPLLAIASPGDAAGDLISVRTMLRFGTILRFRMKTNPFAAARGCLPAQECQLCTGSRCWISVLHLGALRRAREDRAARDRSFWTDVSDCLHQQRGGGRDHHALAGRVRGGGCLCLPAPDLAWSAYDQPARARPDERRG